MSDTNMPYVFISYAHVDSAMVMPVIEAMKNRGINIWYDGGIAAGSEWPEYIADKVINCSKFVLFVSNAYLNSQNCKREINFAISRKKEILSVYLEQVNLSPGMEMQLGTYQAFFKNRFPSDADFASALCSEEFFSDCKAGQTAYTNSTRQGSFNTPPVRTATTPNFTGSYAKAPTPPKTPSYNTSATQSNLPVKNKYIAGALAIFLGSMGIHHFYLGKIGLGILHLLFCWTGIPAFVGFIQGIILFCNSDQDFERKYKCRVK
ncbi:MAG: TIR domain-containing protein [Acutalibacteraceae bacterium]|nr:TIR domain-containing protein [Acutalibacteraceae bacterium]